jgi:hypothetical protein
MRAVRVVEAGNHEMPVGNGDSVGQGPAVEGILIGEAEDLCDAGVAAVIRPSDEERAGGDVPYLSGDWSGEFDRSGCHDEDVWCEEAHRGYLLGFR